MRQKYFVIIGILIMVISIVSIVFAYDPETNPVVIENKAIQLGCFESSERYELNGHMGFGGNGMMNNRRTYYSNDEKLTLDVLTEEVTSYLLQYDQNLMIKDIFVYEDSDYYFSIVDDDTGKGAMELLVNPYTGEVYPEMGPNMMWNTAYDFQRRTGMMGNTFNRHQVFNNNLNTVELSYETIQKIGEDYLNALDSLYTLSDEGHVFSGYNTFHFSKDGVPVGMLSINVFTGDVWLHTWHGKLIEVIEN